jgi:hypothetical protein
MKFLMDLSRMIVSSITSLSARRFERAVKDPIAAQKRLLLSIVGNNADTEYGRRYGFSSITSFADYQRQVPVVSYEDIKSNMERVMAGEKNIFTAEDPLMFARTSGTTGDPKHIPVTPTSQNKDHTEQMRTWIHHAQREHPQMFKKKVLSLVSPAVEGYTSSGIAYGSTSGHVYKNMHWIIRKSYSIPYEVFEIDDYSTMYYAIMRISLEHDVRFVATANPSSIIKIFEKINDNSEVLIKDIHDGTFAGSSRMDDKTRQVLTSGVHPNPERAHQLEKCRSRRSGVLKPVDYWPWLSLIGCWKGGTVSHYVKKFDPWVDPEGNRPVPVRDWGYLSSEARGSIPMSDQGSRGVLTVSANFFEFVPVPELEAQPDNPASWNLLTLEDIEDEQEYYIFITNNAGLYRYDMNDIIKVAGKYQATPQIEFLRKGRGMTNITGEKVSVNHIMTIMRKAGDITGTTPDHFKAEADADKSRYVFSVEFTRSVDRTVREEFLKSLDEHLKDINVEYKSKRESQRLQPPVLHVMKEGWYDRDRKERIESGMRSFQAKTTRLSLKEWATQDIRPEIDEIVEIKE